MKQRVLFVRSINKKDHWYAPIKSCWATYYSAQANFEVGKKTTQTTCYVMIMLERYDVP